MIAKCRLPATTSPCRSVNYPVVLVRDRDCALRAFHNTCRHRGSRICSAERGIARHAWSVRTIVDLSARRAAAVGARHGRRFRPVAARTEAGALPSVGGYICICLAASAPDFEPVREQIEPYLEPHRLQQAKVAFESTIIESANWKLVWENNRECYHCGGNHPELIRTFPEDPRSRGSRTRPRMRGSPRVGALESERDCRADSTWRRTGRYRTCACR